MLLLCTSTIRPWLIFSQALVPLSFASLLLPAFVNRSKREPPSLLWTVTNGRFIAFQTSAWVLWLLSTLLVRPLATRVDRLPPWREDEPVVNGAAATAAFVSQTLMLKSFLVYYRIRDTSSKVGDWYICRLNVVLIDVSIYHHHFHVVKLGPWVPVISQAPSGWASALSSFLSLLLAMLACILLADLEHLDQGRHRAAVALLALAAILVSATSTHGLGGFLRHGLSGDPRPSGLATWRGRKSRSRPQWRFFQPFQGGTLFIATQAAGWILFSLGVIGVAWLVRGVVYCVGCWARGVGATMMGAQILLALSLYTFHATPSDLLRAAKVRMATHVSLHLPIVLMFLPAHMVCATIALTLTSFPLQVAAALLAGTSTLYYVITGWGTPHVYGTRTWPWFQRLMSRQLPKALEGWFGAEVEVVVYTPTVHIGGSGMPTPVLQTYAESSSSTPTPSLNHPMVLRHQDQPTTALGTANPTCGNADGGAGGQRVHVVPLNTYFDIVYGDSAGGIPLGHARSAASTCGLRSCTGHCGMAPDTSANGIEPGVGSSPKRCIVVKRQRQHSGHNAAQHGSSPRGQHHDESLLAGSGKGSQQVWPTGQENRSASLAGHDIQHVDSVEQHSTSSVSPTRCGLQHARMTGQNSWSVPQTCCARRNLCLDKQDSQEGDGSQGMCLVELESESLRLMGQRSPAASTGGRARAKVDRISEVSAGEQLPEFLGQKVSASGIARSFTPPSGDCDDTQFPAVEKKIQITSPMTHDIQATASRKQGIHSVTSRAKSVPPMVRNVTAEFVAESRSVPPLGQATYTASSTRDRLPVAPSSQEESNAVQSTRRDSDVESPTWQDRSSAPASVGSCIEGWVHLPTCTLVHDSAAEPLSLQATHSRIESGLSSPGVGYTHDVTTTHLPTGLANEGAQPPGYENGTGDPVGRENSTEFPPENGSPRATTSGHRNSETPLTQQYKPTEASKQLPSCCTPHATQAFPRACPPSNPQAPPSPRIVFGYSPHGLYPTGAAYLPLLPAFQRHLRCPHPITLTANALHMVPIIRDLLAWIGSRIVSRNSFLRALRTYGPVMVCPGGQEELVEAMRARTGRELVLCTRHRGFCRIAVSAGAALVPVLVLGEIFQLRNLMNVPWMLQATYRRLGFPIPYFLAGRWGITPFPSPVPVKCIIGPAIFISPALASSDSTCSPNPSAASLPTSSATARSPGSSLWGGSTVEGVDEEAVEQLHRIYFLTLREMYKTHARSHPAYKNVELVLKDFKHA